MLVIYQLLLVVLSLRQIHCGITGNSSSIVESLIESEESDTQQLNQKLSLSASSACPPGFSFSSLSGKCYQVIAQPMNWYDARRACQSIGCGAHLVIVETKRQNDAINEYLVSLNKAELRSCLFDSQLTFFTSAQRRESNNCNSDFVWNPSVSVTLPLTYTNWWPGEPTCFSGASENCIVYIGENIFKWYDGSCNNHCSLCETNAVG